MTAKRKRRRPHKKEQKNTAKSFIYVAILIVCAGGLGWYFFYEYGFRTDYNTAVNKLDTGFKDLDSKVIEECMLSLETLRKSNSGNLERTRPIDEHLLKCYRHFANLPELSAKEQISYLKKINDIDPESLSKMEKKLLE